MKYGVFSDVHGNLEAFEVALARLEKEQVEKYIFCGDLIGYGPDPQACVKLYCELAEKGLVVGVKGNHDALLTHPELQSYFHTEALRVGNWSLEQLNEKELRCISYLPEIIPGKDFTVTHGSPRDPIKEYFATAQQYHQLYTKWKGDVLFVGHTHIAMFMKGNETSCQVHAATTPQTIKLQPGFRYVINPGAVGRPRDYDPRAAFGVWDTEAHSFSFMRLAYDLQKTQTKMRAAGLPDFLINSLSLGM